MENHDYYSLLENEIYKDLGHRGIETMWQKGSLREAAFAILKRDKILPSYILTGFCCMFNRCETDGPLGSSVLCSTLRALGYNTTLLTDSYSEPVVRAAAFANPILSKDNPSDITEISFIVSVERPGRSKKTNDFRTMSARDISHCTAPIDLLFPLEGHTKKEYLTIGIGDGGNEVGTGNISDEVCKHVKNGEDICTSICADILIMAGVSNWGALALAAALVIASKNTEAASVFIEQCNKQPEILQKMIDAGSFDGCTGKKELSIDNMMYDKEHLSVTLSLISIVKEAFHLSD